MNNPPAFPEVETTDWNEDYPERPFAPDVHSVGGMTLRDYFAAKALQGLCALSSDTLIAAFGKEATKHGEKTLTETFSRMAYEYADAMLKARESTNPN